MKKTLIFLLLVSIQFVNSQELALVKKDSKIGYLSKDGNFKIEPQYKSARSFSEGLAAVENNGKWGFIDAKGAWVIPADFKNVKDFNSGIAVVQKDKDWVYINTKGEIQKGPTTDKVFDFNDGVAFFRQNNKVGLINNKMAVVLEPKYDQIKPFENGYARVELNKNWGIIDTNGKELVEPVYAEVGNYFKGTTWAKKDKTFGLVSGGKFIPVDGAEKIWDFETQDLTFAKKNGTQVYETFAFGDYSRSITPIALGFDGTLEQCSTSKQIYNHTSSEAIALDNLDTALIQNQITPLNSPRTAVIGTTTNKLVYRLFTNGVLTPNYFCNSTLPTIPAISQEWIAEAGVTNVKGIIEVTTTNVLNTYTHRIVIKKATLVKGNNNFYLGDNYILGDLITTN